jgi:hypothetical protein
LVPCGMESEICVSGFLAVFRCPLVIAE